MQELLPYINTTAILTGVGCLLRLVYQAGVLRTEVRLIMTNHIPHVEAAIRDLREAFIEHIDRGD